MCRRWKSKTRVEYFFNSKKKKLSFYKNKKKIKKLFLWKDCGVLSFGDEREGRLNFFFFFLDDLSKKGKKIHVLV